MSAGPAPAEPQREAFAPYSLETLVSGAARLRPENIAFSDRATTCPYGIVAAQVAALARMLTDYGLRAGERLLLAGGTELSLVIGLIAAVRGGFEPALAPLDLDAEELAACAKMVGAAAILGPVAYGSLTLAETYFTAAAAAPSVRFVGTFGPHEIDGAIDLSSAAIQRYAAAHPDAGLERGKSLPQASHVTTFDRGQRKPVMHQQATLMAAGLDFITRAKIGRGTPILSTLPPVTFAGLVAGPFAALLSGASLYLHGPFDAAAFIKMRENAGHAHLVVPAPVATDFAAAPIARGLASLVVVSRFSAAARFTLPSSLACTIPVVDLYAVDESAVIAERRHGSTPLRPAAEPHFVGFEESRVLTIEAAGNGPLGFRGAAVTAAV